MIIILPNLNLPPICNLEHCMHGRMHRMLAIIMINNSDGMYKLYNYYYAIYILCKHTCPYRLKSYNIAIY